MKRGTVGKCPDPAKNLPQRKITQDRTKVKRSVLVIAQETVLRKYSTVRIKGKVLYVNFDARLILPPTAILALSAVECCEV